MKKSTIIIIVAVTIGMLIAGVVVNHEIRKVLQPIEHGAAVAMSEIETAMLQFHPAKTGTLTNNC